MRIAINGMGRIGRLLFKLLDKKKDMEIVAVNDLMTAENLHYLLKYDSISGASPDEIVHQHDLLTTPNNNARILREVDPEKLPWKELNVDLVVECTGRFTSHNLISKHITAGARKVLLSTTGTSDIPLVIRGLNDSILGEKHSIICSGGCMTNCTSAVLSPLLNTTSIESVHINVLHAYTSRQSLVDGANTNFRRGRASASSIIPVEIDLAETLERLFPKIAGKVTATSTRVPVLCGALADFSIVLGKNIDEEDISALYHDAAAGNWKHILTCASDPIVSADIIGNPHSAILDTTLTKVVKNHIKLGAWFDNEFGYTNRLAEIARVL